MVFARGKGGGGRDRPNFGFGFGAKSCHLVTFGRVLVSAESENTTFGFLSVSAKSDLDFQSSIKSLFLADRTAFVTQSVSWSVCSRLHSSKRTAAVQNDFKELCDYFQTNKSNIPVPHLMTLTA